jgi:hypothetical protein
MRSLRERPSVLLLVAALFCAAAIAQATGEGHVGYHIEGDEVVFTFDASEYEFVTRGDTGQWVEMKSVSPGPNSTVTVVGEFNDWSTDAWVMACGRPGVYELRWPLAELERQGSWAFKFVIDSILWVEPPEAAPNKVPTGLGNRGFNLLLVLSEPEPGKVPDAGKAQVGEGRSSVGEQEVSPIVQVESVRLQQLTLPQADLADICSLKPVDAGVGAAPMPVAANPMIAADPRVINFVSVFVMPPTPEEEAAWEAEAAEGEPGDFMKRMEEVMAERTATVTAAYVAIYGSAKSGAETGVFALEFSEPLTAERRAELSVEGPGGAVVAGEFVAAALWTDDSDASCLESVRAHVESVLGE